MKKRYYVIEGIDLSGKSTVFKELKKQLEIGHYITQPSASKYGKMARAYLNQDEFEEEVFESLLQQDLKQLESFHIKPLRDNGSLIISDRCYVSQLAYTMKDDGKLPRYAETIKNNVKPDYVILLTLDRKTLTDRLKKRKTLDVKEKVTVDEMLKRQLNYIKTLTMLGITFELIYANRPRSEVFRSVLEAINRQRK